MIDFRDFYSKIAKTDLSSWLEILPAQLANWRHKVSSGRQFKKWNNILENLPEMTATYLDIATNITAKNENSVDRKEKSRIKMLLKCFMPWRKGPFSVYGIYVNSEWQSHWKWNRIINHLPSLKNHTVLDVGCSNGYYLWRMLGAGAKMVVGIDPNLLFLFQFKAICKLIGRHKSKMHFLPISINSMPSLESFNMVFSMGMLYHQKSPLEHLLKLKNQIVSRGNLILETIVLNGDKNSVFTPVGRYAGMRNVYFVPSIAALKIWLTKCGFIDIKVISHYTTSITEQRRTTWINSQSLQDFLSDDFHTIEGYPRPVRAAILAKKP